MINMYFGKISAVVLLGEPVQWECSLQVINDLLLTNGHPGVIPANGKSDSEHIPVIACNRDLVFKAAADLPRFGHGAFLTCLEALYKVRKGHFQQLYLINDVIDLFQNLSGNELKYTAFVGKPFEISFQYAEMVANKLAIASGQPKIEKIYFIGDNPDVDIVGANMYNHLLQQAQHMRTSLSGFGLLTDSNWLTATSCDSILVCTGVYDPMKHQLDPKIKWKIPSKIENDVLDAIKHILAKEGRPWVTCS